MLFFILFSHLRWCFAVRDRELVPLVRELLNSVLGGSPLFWGVVKTSARSCHDEVTGMNDVCG